MPNITKKKHIIVATRTDWLFSRDDKVKATRKEIKKKFETKIC